jgi:hypothetical protein
MNFARRNNDDVFAEENHSLLERYDEPQLRGGGPATVFSWVLFLAWVLTLGSCSVLLYWFIREVGWLQDGGNFHQAVIGIGVSGLIVLTGVLTLTGLACFSGNSSYSGLLHVMHWLTLSCIPIMTVFALSIWKLWVPEKAGLVESWGFFALTKNWVMFLCVCAVVTLLLVIYASFHIPYSDEDQVKGIFHWTMFISHLFLMQLGVSATVLLGLSIDQTPEFLTSLAAWSIWAGAVFGVVQALLAILGMAGPVNNLKPMCILLPINATLVAVCAVFNYSLSGNMTALFPQTKGKFTATDLEGQSKNTYLLVSAALGLISLVFASLIILAVGSYPNDFPKRTGCCQNCCDSRESDSNMVWSSGPDFID